VLPQELSRLNYERCRCKLSESALRRSVLNVSVYIATSLDGFIARTDGSVDWLEHDSGDEDYGSQSLRNASTWFQLGVIGDAGPEITNGLGAFRYARTPKPGFGQAFSVERG
jgi:hypothetical protein